MKTINALFGMLRITHGKRGESDAAKAGRLSAIRDRAKNPYVPGTKDFSAWMTAREDERSKLLDSQQW